MVRERMKDKKTKEDANEEGWKEEDWQRVCVGGDMEHIRVPTGTPVWTGWRGEQWLHTGEKANAWVQKTFTTSIAAIDGEIAQLQEKKAQLQEKKAKLEEEKATIEGQAKKAKTTKKRQRR